MLAASIVQHLPEIGTAKWELPRVFSAWWGTNQCSPSIKSKPGMQGGSGSGDPRAARRGGGVQGGKGEPGSCGAEGVRGEAEGAGLRIRAEGQGCRGATERGRKGEPEMGR